MTKKPTNKSSKGAEAICTDNNTRSGSGKQNSIAQAARTSKRARSCFTCTFAASESPDTEGASTNNPRASSNSGRHKRRKQRIIPKPIQALSGPVDALPAKPTNTMRAEMLWKNIPEAAIHTAFPTAQRLTHLR